MLKEPRHQHTSTIVTKESVEKDASPIWHTYMLHLNMFKVNAFLDLTGMHELHSMKLNTKLWQLQVRPRLCFQQALLHVAVIAVWLKSLNTRVYMCIQQISTPTHTHTHQGLSQKAKEQFQDTSDNTCSSLTAWPASLAAGTTCFFMEAGTPTKSQRTPGTTDPASRCTKWLFLVIFLGWTSINESSNQPNY